MTQEEKEFLLKDLCARLPYGVNIEYTSKTIVIATNTEEVVTRPLFLYSINTLDNMTVSGIDDEGDTWICFFEEIKPYLFPLSSMTEEQFVELKVFADLTDEGNTLELVEWNDNYKTLEFWLEEIPSYCVIKVFDWLNKNHFDYIGLIEKGLAIDATNKNIY